MTAQEYLDRNARRREIYAARDSQIAMLFVGLALGTFWGIAMGLAL